MSIAISLFAGATIFFAGFWLGLNPPAKKTYSIKSISDNMSAPIQTEEYRNFLNYDGSVQN